MSNKDDGGSAFPYSALAPDGPTVYKDSEGRTLRDYFAGQALASIITHYLIANGNGCAADHALQNVPALAYKYADAMLRERAQ